MPIDRVTNQDLYTALQSVDTKIDSARRELKGDIQRLDDKFMTMEAGRLTRAETAINRLEVKDATLSTKVYVLVAIITFVGTALMNIFIAYVGTRLK